MITKIRTKGSSDISMSLPPPNDGALRKCGRNEHALRPFRRCAGSPGVACAAAFRRREIGADYSGRRPNCNAAPCGIRPLAQRFRLSTALAALPGPAKGAAQPAAPHGQTPRKAPPKARRTSPRPTDAPARGIATLERIADALERLAPPAARRARFRRRRRLRLAPGRAPARRPVRTVNRVEMSLLKGIDRVRDMLVENTERFARGLPANNALLWGARGMGKSSLVKAAHAAVNAGHRGQAARPAQARRDPPRGHREPARPDGAPARGAATASSCSATTCPSTRDDTSYKSLKAVLEGGIEGRPDNVIFYATSNRRHLMPRDMMENERSTAINPGEAVEEKVSLSDRFGLWLGFHRCSQDEYLAMVEGYVAHLPHPDRRRRAARARRSNGRRRAARAPAASPGNTCRISRDGSA